MTNYSRFLGIGILLACVLAPAAGQITFTAANVSAYLAPGATEVDHSDTVTQTLDIGSPGATSWDLSGLQNNSQSVIVSVPPDSTPYASQFTTATHARKSAIAGSGTSYAYLQLNSNLYALGAVFAGSTTETITSTPPDELIQLPLAYGTQWSTTYTDAGSSVSTQHTDTYTVDAYGILKLPGGLSSQALRVKEEERNASGQLVQITYGIKALNGMSVNIYVIDTTQPNSGTISIAGATWNGPITSRMAVVSPAAGEVVLAAATDTIRWSVTGIDSMKIELSLDSGRTFTSIADNVPADPSQYGWTAPDTISAKCAIRLTDLADTTTKVTSSLFGIKPYIVTRLNANGDFEKFDLTLHAWQFPNDSADMWPQPWWSGFSYAGIDPFTGQNYSAVFTSPRIDARPQNFIDWGLFVNTFSTAACYRDVANAVYSPTALAVWTYNKDPKWNGSCFGFSQSCLLAFDRPADFLQAFPGVGSFVNLHDLAINDNRRLVINQLYEHQFGSQHLAYRAQVLPKTVVQTLQDLKTMLLSPAGDHRSLGILGSSGGHSIVPYKLERTGSEGRFLLYVYDNDCPTGTCGGFVPTAVSIDSGGNTWFYPPLGWGDDSVGLYLRDPANTYLSQPLLGQEHAHLRGRSRASVMLLGAVVDSVTLYTSTAAVITIIDSLNNYFTYRDSILKNLINGAMPIFPENAAIQPPKRFQLPPGRYAAQLGGFRDTVFSFGALTQSAMYNYWRTAVLPSQSDRVTYDNGLNAGNPDSVTKLINLEAIARLDSSERDFQVLNLPAVQNDSVRITIPDSTQAALVNLGPQKTYDLTIVLAGSGSSWKFNHTGITVPAHSTHYILPDWQNASRPVKILLDSGNTGTITDSAFIANQTLGVPPQSKPGIPRGFALEQNYPNPFNPSTVIRYSLPKESHVRLAVYNVLGQLVATLVDESEQAGYREVALNGNNLPSGLYFYRLTAGTFSETRKMLLIK